MNAPKKIWVDKDELGWPEADEFYQRMHTRESKEYGTPYIREDLVDELVEALKFAWPIIEHERYKLEGSYGKNFDSAKADRARQAYEKVKAALAKLEESHD